MNIEKLKDDLMFASAKTNFAFTRDEVIELIGVNNETAFKLLEINPLRKQLEKAKAIPVPTSQLRMNEMKEFVLNAPYGLAKLSTPKYWFDNGKIHSNSGATIGYPHRAVTEDEALAFGAYGLNVCLAKDKQ